MNQNRMITYLYRISLFMLIITGFGQMPVFKRYYIADIPGFGWLAQFYTTHFLHYIFAIGFIFFLSYFASLHLNARKKIGPLLLIKGGVFSGIVVSGFFLVLRNYPGYRFSDLFIVITNLVHLGLVMVLFLLLAVLFIYDFNSDKQEMIEYE